MFDNMPVDVAEWYGPACRCLAVNVGNANPIEYPDTPSLFTVAGMTFTALSQRVNEFYYREPRWLFTPDLHDAPGVELRRDRLPYKLGVPAGAGMAC